MTAFEKLVKEINHEAHEAHEGNCEILREGRQRHHHRKISLPNVGSTKKKLTPIPHP
jgi:hypothetical protein